MVAVETFAVVVEADVRELYAQHSGRLYRFGLVLSGDSARAAEAVQEAFVTLIEKPGLYDPSRGTPLALLYGMVRNRLRSARRNEREEPFEGEEFSDEDLLAGLERAERVKAVREAIASLPEHYREVVALCDLGECGYEEAAAALEVPIGTVRSRLSRARRLLKERLSQYEVG